MALRPNPARGGLPDPFSSILSHSSCSAAPSRLLDKHPAGSISRGGTPARPLADDPCVLPARLVGQTSILKTPFPCCRLSENLEDAGELRQRELELYYVCEGEDAEDEDARPPLLCSLP